MSALNENPDFPGWMAVSFGLGTINRQLPYVWFSSPVTIESQFQKIPAIAGQQIFYNRASEKNEFILDQNFPFRSFFIGLML